MPCTRRGIRGPKHGDPAGRLFAGADGSEALENAIAAMQYRRRAPEFEV